MMKQMDHTAQILISNILHCLRAGLRTFHTFSLMYSPVVFPLGWSIAYRIQVSGNAANFKAANNVLRFMLIYTILFYVH